MKFALRDLDTRSDKKLEKTIESPQFPKYVKAFIKFVNMPYKEIIKIFESNKVEDLSMIEVIVLRMMVSLTHKDPSPTMHVFFLKLYEAIDDFILKEAVIDLTDRKEFDPVKKEHWISQNIEKMISDTKQTAKTFITKLESEFESGEFFLEEGKAVKNKTD